MEYKDIKVGAEYYVQVKVNGANLAKNAICVWACGGHPCYFRLEDFFPISPENGIKNTESAPKYGPCRFFRKGDIVRLKETNGRKLWSDVPHLHACIAKGATFTVKKDEHSGGFIDIVPNEFTENTYTACVFCVELITPVEELEPYFVQEFKGGYGVFNTRLQPETEVCHYFNDKHPHAKQAAEAECARLNAEYRKETYENA